MRPADSGPEFFERGNELVAAGDYPAAADCYRRALEIDPALAGASFNLGTLLDTLAGPGAAAPHYAQAVRLRPQWWEARARLGHALARLGRMGEAADELKQAVALNPDDPGLQNNLALALNALGQGEEAYARFREALRLAPDYPEAHNNLAILLERYGHGSEAIASCRSALALRPDYPEAHLNLGNVLKAQGRHQEALEHYREAVRLKPDFLEARQALLFALCYPAGISQQQIFREHRDFARTLPEATREHANCPDPERRLNIGYLSPDFRAHAVARFIEPVLRHHDPDLFRVTCYGNLDAPDQVTVHLAGLAGRYVSIAGLTDQEALETIKGDGIDILVELSGHSAGNRLPLMALKPAPVQVSWLGYPETTGLDAIDYRISDAVCDPPGTTEPFHSEELIRLPGLFTCFAPPVEAPPVGELPARSRGVVTFGSFNNPAKLTPETVALWAGVLRQVPGSRLFLKGYSFADPQCRSRFVELFANHGVEADRLELVANTPGYREHLALYAGVDIALDSFPYHGTTTTCEALWMGVPVVTLAGSAHRSRVGATLLGSVGLGHLVAEVPEQFVAVAARLAGDLDELARLRSLLRSIMAAAPLTDGPRFTRHLEAAYREAWRTWSARKGQGAEIPARQPAEPTGAEAWVARGTELLTAGDLDGALSGYLAALGEDPGCGPALGGVEATLARQTAEDLAAACRHDAARLGFEMATSAAGRIGDATLEKTATALLARGLITPAELVCRYLEDRGYRSALVSRTLGEVALAIGEPRCAAKQLREAVRLGGGGYDRILLVKAEQAALMPGDPPKERYLLVKAWGYGFWSDVNHVLGQCLCAEITSRTPVVHWGDNSLFGDDPGGNAFENFFEPVGGVTLEELAGRCRSFYPPKWRADNLALSRLDQATGPWSRCSTLHALTRREDLVVSDFHYAVHDLVPWIPPEHPLYGLSTDAVYRHLVTRYLKVRPEILQRVEAFARELLAGHRHLALHVRGGDKGGEDANLALVNSLYPREIERYLDRHPEARLFLSTDDRSILSEYRERYGERLVTTAATRTGNGQGVHYQTQASRRLLGEEVLMDALLAARCDAFVGNGLSNVSVAVAQLKQWPAESCRLLGARLDRLRNFTLYRS
ncbi:hypothetical protein GMLC_20760 [Geomonas limicola]|uniref:protein O-GlcNAc transferase n=1 Tax=Geomonas limicola TaxID=2740186 RepID=A0A6V8N9L3_9BACT|nr:tetratricopeptide repeat protein [Geomonas limicola]GFO68497.1 hypothetical protein GMLC_20760 [Geomonas limicola]